MVEVYKSIADVSSIFVVNGHIDEVVLALEVLVDLFNQQITLVFVGNVSDHDCGSKVHSCFDLFFVNLELRLID